LRSGRVRPGPCALSPCRGRVESARTARRLAGP
jgi:hypothetical protein